MLSSADNWHFNILAYLKNRVLCIVWHCEAEVSAIFLNIVTVCQFRWQLSSSKPGLEIAALTAVFHIHIEIALVTCASNGGQHCRRKDYLVAVEVVH